MVTCPRLSMKQLQLGDSTAKRAKYHYQRPCTKYLVMEALIDHFAHCISALKELSEHMSEHARFLVIADDELMPVHLHFHLPREPFVIDHHQSRVLVIFALRPVV